MTTDDKNTEPGPNPQEIEQPAPGPENAHQGSQASTEYESTPTSEKDSMSEGHEPLLPPLEASIANDEDQDTPETRNESRTQVGSSQSSQDEKTDPYLDNRKARLEHDHKWWGDRHSPPPTGHPDRQHLFAWNPPISDQEVQDTLAAYYDRIRDPETGVLNPLGVHLRPSTPPQKRAEKQLKVLEDDGVDVTPELARDVHDHHNKASGLAAALVEWCEGKDAVPVEHAREMQKMLDRLMLESAKQQRDTNAKLSQVTKDFDKNKRSLEKTKQDYNELLELFEQLEKEKDETQKKLENKQKDIDHFEKTRASQHARRHSDAGSSKPQEPLNSRRASVQLQKEHIKKELQQMKIIHRLEEDVAHLEKENESLKVNSPPGKKPHSNSQELVLTKVIAPASSESEQQLSLDLQSTQKQLEVAMSMVIAADKDCKGAEEARKKVEEEAAKYRDFHVKLYLQLCENAEAWAGVADAIKHLSDETTDEAPNAYQKLILEAAKEWKRLECKYEKGWPANETAFKEGKLHKNAILLRALDKSEKEVQEKFDLNKRLNDKIQFQLKDREDKANNVRELARAIRSLERETSTLGRVEEIPDVKASFEIPRTPIGSSGTSAQASSSGSGNASSSSLVNEQFQAKIRSLELECANLERRIVGAEDETKQLTERNKELQELGATNEKLEVSLQEKERSLVAIQEEVERLTKEVQILRDESKELKAARARDMGATQELSKCNKTIQQQGVEIKNLRGQVDRTQNRNQILKDVNFDTADSLISAIKKQTKAPNSAYDKASKEYGSESEELGLMDRINYLNMACFFRTRNYIQLALREGANRLANVLITDAEKWAKFCYDDLAKMHPSVNDNIAASMRILNGLRRIMTAEKENGVEKGIKSVQAGRSKLAKAHDQLAFGQLVQLADTLLDWTRGMRTGEVQESCKKLFKKSRKLNKEMGFSVEQHIRVGGLQEEIKNNLGMKAAALRRSGFHSPPSPEKWNKNLDEGFDTEVEDD
ncbi:hypothetical protein FSARC_7322 [Fusarium sarcochroum]|uniref:Uncharacterized protein n=1 Tax=Fusarium sarcochroum TaxID=1208366 RepID=A0A8H4X7I1_9HYPO|nr:hypothetical protein FSARC_7322 [Fusarium sarcochroum]